MLALRAVGVAPVPTEFKPTLKEIQHWIRVVTHREANMSLTDKDKAAVKAFWAKVSKSADAIGAEALGR